MRSLIALAALVGLAVLGATACVGETDDLAAERYARVADKSFDDVVLDLQFSIGQHNFAITGRNRLGQAIRGRGERPDFPDAMVVNFCSVADAREAIDIDPALMVYMPCKVTLLQREDGVLVQTMLLPEDTGRDALDTFAGRINRTMREIVDYAASTHSRADRRSGPRARLPPPRPAF